jgi:large subunit ribosomal protein L22
VSHSGTLAKNRTVTEKHAVASWQYARISTRKMGLVADIVRRKPASDAVAILQVTNKKGARILSKVLKSALANAQTKGLDASRLIVKEVLTDNGPTMKRIFPRSQGRMDRMLKRTTHVTIIVAEGKKVVNPVYAPVAEEKAKKINKKTAAKA